MKRIENWLRWRDADPTEANLERRVATLLVTNVVLGLVLVWLNLMVQDLGYRTENTSKLIEIEVPDMLCSNGTGLHVTVLSSAKTAPLRALLAADIEIDDFELDHGIPDENEEARRT